MAVKMPYAYGIIDKSDGRCFQIIQTATPNFSIDNETDYSIVLDPSTAKQYLDKHLIDGQWYERTYDSVDENGFPLSGSTYTDTPM